MRNASQQPRITVQTLTDSASNPRFHEDLSNSHRPLRPGTSRRIEGRSIRPMLENPGLACDSQTVTKYRFGIHVIRTEGKSYFRHISGDEEPYDEKAVPYEWTNRAHDSKLVDAQNRYDNYPHKINLTWIPRRLDKSAR